MALFDSAALLAKCKFLARRPSTDSSVSDAQWYTLLTDAQPKAYRDLFTRFPDLQYGAPTLMSTSTDGGKTYAFGTDAEGNPIRPMGHAELYEKIGDIPDWPLTPGIDFIAEGTQIRIPNNQTRTFVDGAPYYRMVQRPMTAIDGSNQPTLYPKSARMLLVWAALEMWAMRPGSGADPAYFAAKYKEDKDSIYTDLATQYNGQANAPDYSMRKWWLHVG